jgi:glycosyltransferase involved in cell wall biosynthesis
MSFTRLPVSVVIPAHDRAGTIERALASARRQTAQPSEVIVVDDASGDDTAARAEEMGARVVRHERNRGAGSARNTGIEAARNDWIAFLDSDDEWLDHHLATLWSVRGEHVLVAGSALVCREGDGRDRISGAPDDRPIAISSPGDLVFPENFVAESSVMVRRDVLRAVGGYDTSLPFAEDFDLWLRVLECGSGFLDPRVTLVYYRVGTGKSADPERPLVSQRQIVESYSTRPWWSRALLERRLGTHAWDRFRLALHEGRHRDAIVALGRGLLHPQRLAGIVLTLRWRRRLRRRAARLGPIRPREASP